MTTLHGTGRRWRVGPLTQGAARHTPRETDHARGDEVLQQLAEVVRAEVRNTDTVYRYGGEESVVLARETADSYRSRREGRNRVSAPAER